MYALRKILIPTVGFLLVLLVAAQPTRAYSVLTHEALIDLTWADSIQPLLLHRYPQLTAEQLREAHAYAYGGCVIQDLGYYPFGKPLFSDLLHYVRTGDFIRALFRDSKNANEVAFSIGALSHFLGDTIGHPESINVAVGQEFPKLGKKYGTNVNYAEGEHQHVRAEFAFDVDDIVKNRLAPEKYLDHIGFGVPVPLLAKAFYDTYGLDIGDILGNHRPTLQGYRFAVRNLLPRVAYAETLLYSHRMPKGTSSPALDELNRQIAALAAADHWDQYRRHPGPLTHMIAGLIFILPKVGALSDLSLRGPTAESEQIYIASLVHTAGVLRQTLAQVGTAVPLANKDLDTGDAILPGTYRLCDNTYADLLHTIAMDPTTPIPFGIKRDVLAFFAEPEKAIYLKQHAKKFARMEAELPILKTISTHAAYPETAYLSEPAADLAPTSEDQTQGPGGAKPKQ